jgi:hypothetical protein
MIIWRGYGILVAIVGVLSIIMLDFVTVTYALDWTKSHPKITGFSEFFLTALVLYVLARVLKEYDKPKVVIDKESGQEIHLRRGDSLFFIPVGAWPYIVLMLSVYKLFTAK